MEKAKRVFIALTVITLITAVLAIPALAVTAEEVEAHVQEVGREATMVKTTSGPMVAALPSKLNGRPLVKAQLHHTVIFILLVR